MTSGSESSWRLSSSCSFLSQSNTVSSCVACLSVWPLGCDPATLTPRRRKIGGMEPKFQIPTENDGLLSASLLCIFPCRSLCLISRIATLQIPAVVVLSSRHCHRVCLTALMKIFIVHIIWAPLVFPYLYKGHASLQSDYTINNSVAVFHSFSGHF